jgi:cobalt-zinc-cadmium efflux system outer membrane protein
MVLALTLGACYQQSQSYLEGPSVATGSDPYVFAQASEGHVADPVVIDTASPPDGYAYQAIAPYADALTLGEAVRRALRFSPTVHAAEVEIDARRAETLQAGLRPNPELSAAVDNVGEDGQESTLELTQVFELGGKRLKRTRAAELDVGVAGWDYEAARLRVASDTTQAFVDVLASQDRIAILNDLQAVAEKLTTAVSERVKAGKASPVEAQRAQIETARARSELSAERTLLSATKQRLANNWGAQNADFSVAQGQLATTNHIPSPQQISRHLDSNPDIARWATEMTRRRAVLALARATAVPDLTLGAGARRLEENEETGAVVSLSIPLPFYNRNQGNIAAARTRLSKGDRESLAAKTAVTGVFLEAYGRLVVAVEKLKGLEKEILPAAQEVYSATIEGYAAGKFDLLAVLDAQRTLFATRLEIVNARAEFHKAKVQIEALTGRGLYDL